MTQTAKEIGSLRFERGPEPHQTVIWNGEAIGAVGINIATMRAEYQPFIHIGLPEQERLAIPDCLMLPGFERDYGYETIEAIMTRLLAR